MRSGGDRPGVRGATKLVADEMDRWTAVIKAAGVKAE